MLYALAAKDKWLNYSIFNKKKKKKRGGERGENRRMPKQTNGLKTNNPIQTTKYKEKKQKESIKKKQDFLRGLLDTAASLLYWEESDAFRSQNFRSVMDTHPGKAPQPYLFIQ